MVITITIKVIPQAGKQKIWLDKNGVIKCAITSAPEKGKANKELIGYLSAILKIPKNSIIIARGDTDRTKTLVIETHMSPHQVHEKLGIETQAFISNALGKT